MDTKTDDKSAGKCPFGRGRANRDWWPDALDVSTLHRNSNLSDPMGKTFDYESPTVDMVSIIDIAHALSQLCRFNGQSREFYSVAQHSLLVASLMPDGLELYGLLHDASEAYCGDMVRPLKRLIPEYRVIENRVQEVIARRFGLRYPFPDEVKEADNIALAMEGKRFMAGREDEYGIRNLTEHHSFAAKLMSSARGPLLVESDFLREFARLNKDNPENVMT